MEEAADYLKTEILRLRLLQGVLEHHKKVPLAEMGLNYLSDVGKILNGIAGNLDQLVGWLEAEP